MGNPKQKWTAEEEEALRAGIAKHGTGKWMTIHKDPEFNRILSTRTNIDLKDKWRNLSVGNNLGPRDKPHTPKPKPKPKPSPEASSAVPLSSPQTSTPSITVTHDAPADSVTTDSSSRSLADGKLAPWYNAMIFEAFSASKDPKELDTSTILGFIEQKHEGPVPTNVRRYLTSRLRKLAQQDKLEKVQNGLYRLKTEEPLSNTRTPLPKQKDISPAQAPSTPTINQCSGDAEREAAIAAAYKIAEAENKACVAVEAVKEAERVSKMAEDADALLQLAIEIFDRCLHGETVLLA